MHVLYYSSYNYLSGANTHNVNWSSHLLFEVVLPVVDGHRVVVPPEAMDERLYISGGDNCQCYISCDRCTLFMYDTYIRASCDITNKNALIYYNTRE